MRYWTDLNKEQKDGKTLYDHLKFSAKGGGKTALKKLAEEPVLPSVVAYLVDWSMELRGRSGAGMGGLAPLSFTTIKHWSELMQVGNLHPWEVEALLLLDAAQMEKPEKPPPDKGKGKGKPVRIAADSGNTPWPSKKG